jgi:hypothetical protein
MLCRDGFDEGTASNFMQISEKCDGDPGNDDRKVRGR